MKNTDLIFINDTYVHRTQFIFLSLIIFFHHDVATDVAPKSPNGCYYVPSLVCFGMLVLGLVLGWKLGWKMGWGWSCGGGAGAKAGVLQNRIIYGEIKLHTKQSNLIYLVPVTQ